MASRDFIETYGGNIKVPILNFHLSVTPGKARGKDECVQHTKKDARCREV